MKIIPRVLFILLISLIMQYLFKLRFEELMIVESQINSFLICFNITILVFIFGVIRFNNILNPITIITLFLFSFSYNFIEVSNSQVSLTSKSITIIFLSVFFYLLFASSSINVKTKPKIWVNLTSNHRRKVLFILVYAGIIVYIIECFKWGYIPITKMTEKDTYGDAVGGGYNFFHNAILLLNVIPAWVYIYYKEKIVSTKQFKIILYISVFISFNYLSKQTILLLMISSFASYLFYNKINNTQYILIFTAIGSIFIFTNYIRLMNYDRTYVSDINDYTKTVANIDLDKDLNVTEIMFIEYSSKRFSSFQQMIQYSDDKNFFGYGMYTLRPLTSLLFLESLGILSIDPELDSRAKVGTYIIDPYLDFGIIGVILFSCFYGIISNRYYYQFTEKNIEAIGKFTLVLQFFLMAVFINYYNTFFIWSVFIVNKILTGGLVTTIKERQ